MPTSDLCCVLCLHHGTSVPYMALKNNDTMLLIFGEIPKAVHDDF